MLPVNWPPKSQWRGRHFKPAAPPVVSLNVSDGGKKNDGATISADQPIKYSRAESLLAVSFCFSTE
ncbi:hypothetical protein DAPPUDRAFT_252274 [Daphnia pulex]|uniref:Uncharacterized protein n=1 Tax=Daphnia pulex TaxID=6669 RepID=E9H2E0_DAPPU|nr:hypothetical protein DAPPUDRAFT_252274 [Daphnia pulex]|eukprot:EFX74159.1 hypothetical protein DAPPUDRAFT_252274 [Daphnia pulex]